MRSFRQSVKAKRSDPTHRGTRLAIAGFVCSRERVSSNARRRKSPRALSCRTKWRYCCIPVCIFFEIALATETLATCRRALRILGYAGLRER